LWDVEATVWGAPEIHGVHYQVSWLQRLARFLRREKEIAVVAFLLILLTVDAFWP
jgi:cell division protein FtsX